MKRDADKVLTRLGYRIVSDDDRTTRSQPLPPSFLGFLVLDIFVQLGWIPKYGPMSIPIVIYN